MATAGDNLSTLFRSLGPDDSNFLARTKASALEAEQRWPLFKAVAPKKATLTPPLTEQEKGCWNNPEKFEVKERKPALTLPGLSIKLAKSLSEISERTSLEAAATAQLQRPTSQPAAARQPIAREPVANVAPPAPTSHLFANPSAPSMQRYVPEPAPFEPEFVAPVEKQAPTMGGIFGRFVEEPIEAPMPESNTANDNSDALTNVFNRLIGKNVAPVMAETPRASFLDRLGSR